MATASSGSSNNDKFLVAAIDIGTVSSGYAFSFKNDYNSDPSNIQINTFWAAGHMVSMKAPTCVLFDENKLFHSFGYEAQNAYSELALDGEHGKWYFFSRFKMRLIPPNAMKVHRDTEVEDDKGMKMLAMTVFSEVIRYLVDLLLKTLEKRGTGLGKADIHWILTVPAIWSDSAKQFMREAAIEVGIKNNQLSLVSEPEAAALFCQLAPHEPAHTGKGKAFYSTTGRVKFIVIDAKENVTEINVLEKQLDGLSRAIHGLSGGAWGWNRVESEFFQMLIKIVGTSVYATFCAESKADHLDLQRTFSTKCPIVTPESTGKITIKIPLSIEETYTEYHDKSIQEAIAKSPYNKSVWWLNDRLRIDADVFKGFFKPCTDRIVAHIKEILQKPGVTGTNVFLLVGEFSESPMLQAAVREAFPRGEVIVPDYGSVGVLKGAVIYGHMFPDEPMVSIGA